MRSRLVVVAGMTAGSMALAACSSNGERSEPDAGSTDRMDASNADSVGARDAGTARAVSDAEASAPSRFITKVVSFDPGRCAGYGQSKMPQIVEGPPEGGGDQMGSTDVVSLGDDGTIVVSFSPNSIVDGPGPDFIVFENTFDYGGGLRDAEPGEVSVSEDGTNWTVFPCHDTSAAEPDGGWASTECAGLSPVYSNPNNDISPFDVSKAGGDAFDLATIGVTKANFIRIRSVVTGESCPDGGDGTGKNGFDLDAIAIVNAALP